MDTFVLKEEKVCIKEYESVSIIGVTEDGRKAEINFPAKDLYVELNREVLEDMDSIGHLSIQSKSEITCTVNFTFTGCTFRYD